MVGGLHARGPDHRRAERQLQLSVDHQPTEQNQPDRHAGLGGGFPHHCVVVCAKVRRDKMFANILHKFKHEV